MNLHHIGVLTVFGVWTGLFVAYIKKDIENENFWGHKPNFCCVFKVDKNKGE